MDLAERYLYFRSMPGGPTFDEAALLPLAEQSEEVAFRRGAVVLDRDVMPQEIYFLMQGGVVLRRDGHEVGRIEAPGALGVLAVMAELDMPYEAVATEDVIALALDAEVFRETFEDNFRITSEVVRALSGSLLGTAEPHMLAQGDAVLDDIPPRLLRASSLGLVERMLIVRRYDVFGPGALTGLTELAQLFEERWMQPGEVLYREGEHADMFYLLVEGALRFSHGPHDEAAQQSMPSSNLETLARTQRASTATAQTRARLLAIPWESMVDVLEDHPEMMLALLARLAGATLERIGSFAPPGARPLESPPAAPLRAPSVPPAPTTLPSLRGGEDA